MEKSGKKILVVDDDPEYSESVQTILQLHGYSENTILLKNGAEVLVYLYSDGSDKAPSNELPGLILLDIKMPKIDGLQVLAIIRDVERTKNIPVVMLTSSVLAEDMEKAMKFGANGYLVKPIDIEELISTIRSYLH